MIPILFFLTAFMTSWYGYADTGYYEYTIYESDDIGFDCKHNRANGCLMMVDGKIATIISSIETYASKGCTVQTHEFFHLMNYLELEIPQCIKSQEFRVIEYEGFRFIGN